MNILSHRGIWKSTKEKNSFSAFKLSFESNFGVELDVRDYNGELLVSHDIPTGQACLYFKDFLQLYQQIGNAVHIAVNIKSDGLQGQLEAMLNEYRVKNYFLFDMSVPEQYLYSKNKFKVFSRQSEFEINPVLYESACGIWLDSFKEQWFSIETVEQHLNNSKKVCIVSPELHGREHISSWVQYKEISDAANLFLCTDFPFEARRFFCE